VASLPPFVISSLICKSRAIVARLFFYVQ
jgi:hypothetical protein